jgi:feruloyl esterase
VFRQVIGSPANPMSRLLPWELHTTYLTRPVGSPQWISSDLWAVIHEEVLKQCDAIDGVSTASYYSRFGCHC